MVEATASPRSRQAIPTWSMRVSNASSSVAVSAHGYRFSMRDAVIIGGARTAIGRLLGSLSDFSGADLGGIAIKAALERSGVAGDQVDYVIMGQVLQAGAGQIRPGRPRGAGSR